MTRENKYRLSTVFLADFVLFAVLFGVFMYFHYYKSQMNSGNKIDHLGQITKPSVSTDSNLPDTPGQTDSGQFGAAFPERFLNGEKKQLVDDKEIRDYLSSMSFEAYDGDGNGKFIGLYQSGAVFMTVLRVDYTLISGVSGNPHKERYFVYDFYIRDIENLYSNVTNERKDFEELINEAESTVDFPTDDVSVSGLPIAAVNGDYWGNTNHTLIAERNGSVLHLSDRVESDVRVLYWDGIMQTYAPEEFVWSDVEKRGPYQIWNFGPGLIDANGEAVKNYSSSSYDPYVINSRHPRTVMGYFEPGHYCFVTIDGRSDYSDGMTMVEVADLMKKIGCRQAYNMDGGDSTYGYYGGTVLRCNEDRAENGNSRKIYDIICVGEVVRSGNSNKE